MTDKTTKNANQQAPKVTVERIHRTSQWGPGSEYRYRGFMAVEDMKAFRDPVLLHGTVSPEHLDAMIRANLYLRKTNPSQEFRNPLSRVAVSSTRKGYTKNSVFMVNDLAEITEISKLAQAPFYVEEAIAGYVKLRKPTEYTHRIYMTRKRQLSDVDFLRAGFMLLDLKQNWQVSIGPTMTSALRQFDLMLLGITDNMVRKGSYATRELAREAIKENPEIAVGCSASMYGWVSLDTAKRIMSSCAKFYFDAKSTEAVTYMAMCDFPWSTSNVYEIIQASADDTDTDEDAD